MNAILTSLFRLSGVMSQYYPPVYAKCPEWSPSFRFFSQNALCDSFLSYAASCPIFLNQFDLSILIIFVEESTLWSTSSCSFYNVLVTSFLFGPNILLRILFANMFSVWERAPLIPIQNNRQSYNFVYINPSGYQTENKKKTTFFSNSTYFPELIWFLFLHKCNFDFEVSSKYINYKILWCVRVAPLITCGFWITYVDLLDQTYTCNYSELPQIQDCRSCNPRPIITLKTDGWPSTSLVACYLRTNWLLLEYSLSRLSEDWIGNTFHNISNSLVVTQRSQLLLFAVGETCLAAQYMRAPISRLSGDTSQYYIYICIIN
jgi:hypothetical protein